MSDPLLPWYQRELEFFRQMSGDFASRFPKIAARLGMDAQGISDPHVERLIQAVAYLNARIRYKIDDDFPEVVDALLNVLYPHFLSPFPSCGIVQFALDSKQALAEGYQVPAGTALETEPVNGHRCQFRTVYPVRAWPLVVTQARYALRPFAAPVTRRSRDADALLQIDITPSNRELPLGSLPLSSLRFHLHASQAEFALRLYKAVLSGTVEAVLATGPEDPEPIVLPPGSVHAVGFESDEGLLPYGPRSFPGYRLLTEYFAFPSKFLFIEVSGWSRADLGKFGSRLSLLLYLKGADEDLPRAVTTETVRLGCTPIVNLFPVTADAFTWDQRRTETKLVPDARRVEALEVYSVDDVRLLDQAGEEFEARPFFSVRHAQAAASACFWQAIRRPGSVANEGLLPRQGSDVYLSLVDLDFAPWQDREVTVHVRTTCFNGDWPAQLPFGGGRPVIDIAGGRGPLAPVQCLTPLSPPRRSSFRHGNLWKLYSHLSLNHYSLSGGPGGVEALREILKLYEPVSSLETAQLLQGILKLTCEPAVARLPGPATSFCRGLDVRLELDEEKFGSGGAYLFAQVLERFLGLYVSLNSFTRLTAVTRQQHLQKDLWTWPARSGQRALL